MEGRVSRVAIFPQAWRGMRGGMVEICASCPDKGAADGLAAQMGLRSTHGICPACSAVMLGAAGLSPMNATSPVAAPARRYVLASEVAAVCDLSVYDLDMRWRPAAWAAPRDFLFRHGRLEFAVGALTGLADALQAGGQTDAALRLRAWAAPRIAAEAAERSPEPVSWARDWEQRQDDELFP